MDLHVNVPVSATGSFPSAVPRQVGGKNSLHNYKNTDTKNIFCTKCDKDIEGKMQKVAARYCLRQTKTWPTEQSAKV